MGGVTPSDLRCLSSLVVLDLSQNDMHHIPATITQLRNLEDLNISHCKMLEEIPELPSGLRTIDAHDCPSLRTLSNPSNLLWSSLLKYLKKVEGGYRKIHLRSYGAGVLHQEMGSRELPMNWYEDDHFLGFGFSFLHRRYYYLDLSLKFDEEEYTYMYSEEFPCRECHGIDGNGSDEVMLLYIPKTAIQDKFQSNQYMHLEASFHNSWTGGSQSCGVHFIYSEDHQQNHISSLDFPENSDDNKSTTRDIKRSHDDAVLNQAEEPYHKLNHQVEDRIDETIDDTKVCCQKHT